MTSGTAFITDRPFWRPSAVATRQRELLGYLVEAGPVDLVYLGMELGEFERLAARLATTAAADRIRCEALTPTLDLRRAAARVARLVAERWPARVLVASAELAWVPDYVPAEIPVILDAETADPAGRSRAGETALFVAAARFDRVVFARETAYARAAALLGAARCAFGPPPVALAPAPPAGDTVRRIGVNFGAAWVDRDALVWLHDAVWQRPELAAARATVEVVVGGATGADDDLPHVCPDFRFVGPVEHPQPFFAAVDIVVAPQRESGAALSAVVDCLGFSRPLLATPAAVGDLAGVLDGACRVAADTETFAADLAALVADPEARRNLAAAALAVARERLTPEACFRAFTDPVEPVRPPPAHAGGNAPQGALSIGQVLAQGLSHQRAGRLAQAEHLFRRILAQAPRHAETLHALGTLLMQKGDAEAAADVLRRAAELRPENPGTWNNLATALNVLSRFDAAFDAAGRALALRPAYVEARIGRARAGRNLGRIDAALADCEAALELRPEAPETLHERGLLRWAAGDLAAAEADLRAACAARADRPSWGADLLRLRRRRQGVRLPRVALCCRGCGVGLPPAWEPVWALPDADVEALAPGVGAAERCRGFDLIVTDDADFARACAGGGGAVWYCGGKVPAETPGMRVFPAERRAIFDIAANLAVWTRAAKAVAAAAEERYTPQEPA